MYKYVHYGIIHNSERLESVFFQFSVENSLNKLQHSHALDCCYADLKIIMKINIHYKEKYSYIHVTFNKRDYKTAFFNIYIEKHSKASIEMLIRFLSGWGQFSFLLYTFLYCLDLFLLMCYFYYNKK